MILIPITIDNSVHENIVIAADKEYIIQSKQDIEALIHKYAEEYGVPYSTMHRIIACETANTFNPMIQSSVIYNFSSQKRGIVEGTREESYGLAQIHLPDHPEVALTEAQDPEFAIKFMAEHLSKDKYIWYCK